MTDRVKAESPVPASTRPGSAEDLARLRRERDEADRAYNDALTVLDASIQHARELPSAPPPFDERQIAPLNDRWALLSLRPADRGGWLRRLRAHVWTLVAPLFERQESFNAALVDHINRNLTVHRESARALAALLTVCREELERLVAFESKLIQYAQEITPYVDTKDRYAAGLSNTLAAGISAVSDDLHKRWESMVARERRYQAQVDEVRSTLGVAHRAILAIKRELEERGQGGTVAGGTGPPAAGGPPLNAYKYVGFEDQFRGSPREIRERMVAYLPCFDGSRDVVDIGCGRGEFLDLLRERGIVARGVDSNAEMAGICRERGLEATSADALSYLLSQPDVSLGGIFAAQVVEHLEPDYLMRLLEAAFHKLRPGSKIVLETVNPACWYAFFSSYIRDITHVRPLHPDTLRYLLVASGFQRVDVRYSAPFPDDSKLQAIPALPTEAPLSEMVAVLNENVGKLNGLLFSYLDYAVVGERL